MKLHGKITQIQSDFGNVYMNIDDDIGCGYVGVEFATFRRPTYLLSNKDSSVIRLMVFADAHWADEWFERYGSVFEDVRRLDVQDTSVASEDSPEK